MADNPPIPLTPKAIKTPGDAADIDSLWLDPALGDGLVDVHYHSIPVGKPRDYFRVNPDPAYRRMTEIYVHKTEGQVEEQTYIIDKPMRGAIEEARRCTLVTVIYPRRLAATVGAQAAKGTASAITMRGSHSAIRRQSCDGKMGQADLATPDLHDPGRATRLRTRTGLEQVAVI